MTNRQVEIRFREFVGTHFSYKTLKAQFDRIKDTPEIILVANQIETSNRYSVLDEAEPLANAVVIPVNSSNFMVLADILTIITVISSIVTVIQADHHQGHIRYGGYGGYQCTGIVMYSLALSRLLPCEVWNTEILNYIISEGTQYYIQCINKSGESRPRYLGTLNVLGEIHVRGTLFVSQYGMGNEARSTNLNRIRNISLGLKEFYESECDLAVLISAYYSYGIIKSDNMLYFVDSHSKDRSGQSVRNGYGGVRIYMDVNSLAEYIISISANHQAHYELTFISIIEPVDIEGNYFIFSDCHLL